VVRKGKSLDLIDLENILKKLGLSEKCRYCEPCSIADPIKEACKQMHREGKLKGDTTFVDIAEYVAQRTKKEKDEK